MTTNANPTPIPSPSAHPAGASHGPSLSLTIPSRYRGADPLLLRIEGAGTDGAYLVAGIDRFDAPWAAFERGALAARLREMADALDPMGAAGGGEARIL